MSPLAIIAHQAGYRVSGSDKTNGSPYLKLMAQEGITNVGYGVNDSFIASCHKDCPIDWYVYSSAVEKEYPNHPEFQFCKKMGIRMSKRDEFLNEILSQKNLKLLAIAGTHGKTTTTAMVVWLFKQLGLPVSYSIGAKVSFGEMGHYDSASSYFVYECDEFDRNFLAFKPYLSLISGVSWDHHEIYPTQESYNQAFRQFISQSAKNILWQTDAQRLSLSASSTVTVKNDSDGTIDNIRLVGQYNRQDAYLAASGVAQLTNHPIDKLLDMLSNFPGVSRRFEKITNNLYTDYAHTPEKIAAALNVAQEAVSSSSQKLIVVYEPLTNRRMHHTINQHKALFENVDALYWVPSFLAREDPAQLVLEPKQIIQQLSEKTQSIASPARLDQHLKATLQAHLDANDLVLCLSGGGDGSLDAWLRAEFK